MKQKGLLFIDIYCALVKNGISIAKLSHEYNIIA